MKITVIGATGMVGSRIVAEAASRGHTIIAASRNATDTTGIESSPPHNANPHASPTTITPMRTDANSPTDLDQALTGAEAIVLAARAEPGREAEFVSLTRTVLDAGARAGIRVLIVGGAGPLHSPNASEASGMPHLTVIDDADFVPPEWRSIASASVTQLAECTAHHYRDWTYLSPPAILGPGTRTGVYRRGSTTLLTDEDGASKISAEDLAVAVIDELEDPAHRHRFTVAH